ncbi:ATP-binding protein [Aquiflexum lacus]|uniref:ATP-binding protein n=1 Tax=Aquiflexum lacus TaxID=2483805 RepID=UPI00189368EB|nr:ATP-binding protein [Aquiflexum lacus]
MVFKEDIEAAYDGQKRVLAKDFGFIKREMLEIFKPSSTHVEVISGIRRSGKSTLMRQIVKKYYEKVAYFNFEDSRVFGFEVGDFSKLDDVMGEDVEAYFFDEIQNVKGWEVFVRQLHERGEKVFVTGSNASLLSREMGTRLTGRYLSHEVFPFSYKEYLTFLGLDDSQENFNDYVVKGGFPEFLRDQNPEILQMLLKDILYRDIAVRYGIKNTHVLMDIALFLISNIGKEVSFNGIRKTFNVGSPTTVSDYLSWMEDSYLLFFLPRFSWSSKSISKNPKKVYCIDTGFAKSNSLSFIKDKGRLLENLVYLNFRKKNKKLYYFKEKKECDFVVFEGTVCRWLIQVTNELNPDNRDREVEGLVEAMGFFNMDEGYIITMNQSDQLTKENKKIIIQDFKKFFDLLN